MSTYTIQLRKLVEAGYPIWDTDRPFPIFDEDYREELQQKIIDHYYLQEIGSEVPRVFTHLLNTRMREIMPKYNAMYRSMLTVTSFDNTPLIDLHRVETDVKDEDTDFNEGTRQTKNDAHNDISKGFDTPMNADAIDEDTNISSGRKNEYADNVTHSGHEEGQLDHTDYVTNNTRTTDESRTNLYDKVEKYRRLFWNIDEAIIKELADLFMMVF